MRTLLLLRHATTESARPGHHDRDRRLTEVGEREAAAVGDRLRADGVRVDLVLCSPATRTRQTVEGLGLAAPTVVTDQLYDAGGDEIVDLLRETDDTVDHLLVVAHAPGLPAVVHDLVDPEGSDAVALAIVGRRFPAGTLATLGVEGSWADLHRAVLLAVDLPAVR
jgi:phosphohistidine phosphatase